MVDNEGNLLAILGWEFVNIYPIWYANRLPKVLEPQVRKYKHPRKNWYVLGPGEDTIEPGVCDYYYADLEEYEQTMLRPVYVREMERLLPGWTARFNEDAFYREFMDMVIDAQLGDLFERNDEWVGRVERGESVEGLLKRDTLSVHFVKV